MKHNPDEHGGKEHNLGEPIAELAGFEYDVSTVLLSRIRRAIGRRTVAAHITSFTFDMQGSVLKEVWEVVSSLLGSNGMRKG